MITTERHPTDPATARRRHRSPVQRPRVLAVGAVAAWLLLVLAGRRWALHLIDDGVKIVLFTPPVLGGYRSAVTWLLIAPAAFATLIIAVGPRAVERWRWSRLVVAASAAGLGWYIVLGLVDGLHGLTRGLYWKADYAEAVARAAAHPGAFLRGYVPDLASQPIALRGHPPGFVLLFAVMDRIGLGGEGWAAAITLLVGASAVAAVMITIRVVAGEEPARRSAPFLVLAPAAIWIATSTDALTMGTAAWVVALVTLAASRHDRVGDALAVGAGVMAAGTVLQSYGLVLLAVPIVVIAIGLRRARPLVIAAVVGFVLTALPAAVGFWWVDGLFATTDQYHSLDLDRPYVPFLLINLAAWGLALGPATAAGLARTTDRRVWLVVGGGVLAALTAGLSGLSNGEVERIWLPFTIWVLPAGAALWSSRRAARGWLALQAGTALVITSLIATNW